MNFTKHFSPLDISKASEEYWCAMDLLSNIMTKLQQGEIEAAKQRSIDLLKSIHELSKMSSEKYGKDRNEFINRLNTSGVHIELVRRQLLDRKNS